MNGSSTVLEHKIGSTRSNNGYTYTATLTFSQDNNGFITPQELSRVMTNLGHDLDPKEIIEMIVEADMDNDGKISFQEFKRLMSS